MLLPGNFVYQMSSWTRAIVIPLIDHSCDESEPAGAGWVRFQGAFRSRRHALELAERSRVHDVAECCSFRWTRSPSSGRDTAPATLRKRAILRAEQWMLERTKYSDGLGAIYPSMQYVIMALDVLGYAPDHPDRVEAQRQFDALMVETDEEIFFQPCFSPVWDTAIAGYALGESGMRPTSSVDSNGGLAVDQGSSPQGRLVDQEA